MRVMKILLCGLLMALPVLAEEAEDRQTATSLHYVSHELDTRQNKLSTGTNAALTYTNTAGNVVQRDVKANLNGGTTDTSLPMVNAVNAGLDSKQDDITTIDDHTAVTYTGQTGQIGQKGIYQTDGTYATQTNALIDAKTFNAALKNGLDNEFVCADRPDAHAPGTNTCWLWEIHNPTNETIEIHGKNLFDGTITNFGFNVGERTVSRNPSYRSIVVKVRSDETYTFSRQTAIGNRFTYYFTVDEPALGVAGTGYATLAASVLTRTFTVPSGYNYVVMYFDVNGTDISGTQMQVELGTIATAYEPYVGETVNVYLPQNQ